MNELKFPLLKPAKIIQRVNVCNAAGHLDLGRKKEGLLRQA